MNKTIIFPHLGIYLDNVGKSINVLGLEVAYYGIIIGFGFITGMFIATRLAKQTNQNVDLYYDLSFYGMFFGIIGARIYYVLFSWDSYKDDLIKIFNIRGGGLAIYGGIIGSVITVYVFSRKRNVSMGLLLDTVSAGIMSGQMIGRWGNFFNREAFGDYTDNIFAMQLPVSAIRSGEITGKMAENIAVIDGSEFVMVHPTFLYESIWCLVGVIILLFYRKRKLFDGEVFLVYLLIYAAGRFWIEALRTDQLQFSNGYAVSRILAGIIVLVSPVIILLKRRRAKENISK